MGTNRSIGLNHSHCFHCGRRSNLIGGPASSNDVPLHARQRHVGCPKGRRVVALDRDAVNRLAVARAHGLNPIEGEAIAPQKPPQRRPNPVLLRVRKGSGQGGRGMG